MSARFIEAMGGVLLAQSDIRRIAPKKRATASGYELTEYFALTSDGLEHCLLAMDPPPSGELVPNANPNIVLVSICVMAATDDEPETIDIEEIPVIAWRIHSLERIEGVPASSRHMNHQTYFNQSDMCGRTALLDRSSGRCWAEEGGWETREQCTAALIEDARHYLASKERAE